MDEQKQDDQLEPTYSSYVPIGDVTLKTYQKEWTIERSGVRRSLISALMAGHDDDDDVYPCRIPATMSKKSVCPSGE